MPAALNWDKMLRIDPETLNERDKDEVDKVFDLLVLVMARRWHYAIYFWTRSNVLYFLICKFHQLTECLSLMVDGIKTDYSPAHIILSIAITWWLVNNYVLMYAKFFMPSVTIGYNT